MAADSHLYHIYGVRNDLPNLLCFVDENSVVYPAGANIVYHNLESNQQRFIPLSDQGKSLRAMVVSRGQYIAFAEQTTPFAAIIVYDLSAFRKKRTMVSNELNSTTYTGLDFAENGKTIVGIGGAPDYNLVFWSPEKGRLLACTIIGHAVNCVRISPRDSNRVAMCSPGMMKIYKLEENQCKLEPKSTSKANEFFEFISLAWVTDSRILLGTAKSQIILWEDGILIRDILNPTVSLSLHSLKLARPTDMPVPIERIVVHPSGFCCTYGVGTAKNFEASPDGYVFQKDIKIVIEDKALEYGIIDEQQINDLTISPVGDVIAVVTDKRQIFSAKLRDLRKAKEEYHKMKPLFYVLHSAPVTGVDMCVRKPLVVTCSADRSIRIWNFYNRDCEIWKKFPEEPHSVAIHPSGLYLLAGFTDKLKMMHILNDDIKTVRELPIRGCREVKFCHGGHLFAAANGAVVQIYSTIQFDNWLNLKGHTARIRCLLWSHDDIHLFSSSQDGSLFEWDLLKGEIIHEVTLRGSLFVSLAAAPDSDTVFGITAEGIVKEIVNGHVQRDIKCPDTVLTNVALSRAGHCLMFGTSTGTLRTLSYPLPTDPSTALVFQDTPAHQTDITRTIVSFDEQLLVSTSSDGNILIFKIVEGELARVLRRDKPSPYSEEILIERKELDLKNAVILELTTKTEEIQLEHEYQKRAKDSLYAERLKDVTDGLTKEIDVLKAKNERVTIDKDQADQQHQQDMSVMAAKFNHDLLEQERITNQKLLLEYEKYAELIVEKEKQETGFKDQLQDVMAAKEDAIERLTAHYETKIESLHSILERTQREFAEYQREHDELRHMMEEDADMEIVDIRARYETAIFELKDTNMRLKGENGVMKKKINNLLKDIDDHKAEVMKYQADLTKQLNVSKGLEKEIESWKKELKEREENLQDKEKRIHELKKKNQELEKFKFVLDFKIKELRKQIEPKDDEITEQNKKIKALEEQIGELEEKSTDLKTSIHNLNTTLEFTRKERDAVTTKLKERETFVRRFQGDVEMALKHTSSPALLREDFLRINEKYVGAVAKAGSVNTSMEDHVTRERALTKEVTELRSAATDVKTLYERKVNVLSRKLWKMMQQNTSLIEEISVFRQEITALKTRLALLDTAVQGTNPRHKDDYSRIQGLLKEVEQARLEELEKAGVIELYRHELRRLHLLLMLMRQVINNDGSPGVQELVERLQDYKLPPIVGPSKIDLVADIVVDKVTHRMTDRERPESGRISPISLAKAIKPQAKPLESTPVPPNPSKEMVIPKPETKAEIPPKQVEKLKASVEAIKASVDEQKRAEKHGSKKSQSEIAIAVVPAERKRTGGGPEDAGSTMKSVPERPAQSGTDQPAEPVAAAPGPARKTVTKPPDNAVDQPDQGSEAPVAARKTVTQPQPAPTEAVENGSAKDSAVPGGVPLASAAGTEGNGSSKEEKPEQVVGEADLPNVIPNAPPVEPAPS